MTKKKTRKLTDDEMDALVIVDADDESAWGDPIPVGPSKSPRPAWIKEKKNASKLPHSTNR
jgi:hypothetical protein